MSRMTRWWLPALALLLVAAPGCTKKTETTSTTSTNTTTEPGTTTQGGTTVSVVAVDLGRNVDAEKKVTEHVDTFKPNDTIYASVLTNGSAPNARIGVKWMYQDGQVVDQSEQIIAPNGSAATEFHITKPDGLPAGDYKVEVSVDGSSVQTKDFKVTAS
jgi:hypothetical protein